MQNHIELYDNIIMQELVALRYIRGTVRLEVHKLAQGHYIRE